MLTFFQHKRMGHPALSHGPLGAAPRLGEEWRACLERALVTPPAEDYQDLLGRVGDCPGAPGTGSCSSGGYPQAAAIVAAWAPMISTGFS